jgi:hypothetical protein
MKKLLMIFVNFAKAVRDAGFSYVGSVNSSAKMLHSQEESHQYTYIVYLAPAKESGYQVCSHATKECKMGCLATSGHAGMDISSGKLIIQNCRIKKTRLLFEQQDFFMAWMIAEIKRAMRKAVKDGFYFSVRLNGTSDIDWSHIYYGGKNIFEIFPETNFYDYTKNANKFLNKPANYHLTYSYTGRNWKECKALLEAGNNVAVVFDVKNEKAIPAMYKGYEVINGDLTDYRIDDGNGIIVGLKWKHIANKEAERYVLNSCFVVKP